MNSLSQILSDLRVLFPEDDSRVIRFFAAAIIAEEKGDTDKALSYLEKACRAEEEAEKAQ